MDDKIADRLSDIDVTLEGIKTELQGINDGIQGLIMILEKTK